MRDLTRDDKLRIAAEADRICGIGSESDDYQILAFDDALAVGPRDGAPWTNAVRTLATAAMADPVDALTAEERIAVEFIREHTGDIAARELLAILDRYLPKVPA